MLGSYAFCLVSPWWPSYLSYSNVVTLGEQVVDVLVVAGGINLHG
jgi:hypothetical protein